MSLIWCSRGRYASADADETAWRGQKHEMKYVARDWAQNNEK